MTALRRASHSGEIALPDLRCLRSTLAAAPFIFECINAKTNATCNRHPYRRSAYANQFNIMIIAAA